MKQHLLLTRTKRSCY